MTTTHSLFFSGLINEQFFNQIKISSIYTPLALWHKINEEACKNT